MRILVYRRNGGLGDVVCMLPAIDALGAKYPGAQIDVALPPEYAALLTARLGAGPSARAGSGHFGGAAKTASGSAGEKQGLAPRCLSGSIPVDSRLPVRCL